MKLRNTISATLLITSLVLTSGCDSALIHEDGADQLGTAQKALTHETASVSNPVDLATSLRDTATITDSASTITGPVFYPNRDLAACLADGNQSSSERDLYEMPADCCRNHFGWKYDACLADTRLAAQEVAETNDSNRDPVRTAIIIHDEENVVAEVPTTINIPTDLNETGEETGTNDEDTDEQVEFDLPTTVNFDNVSDDEDMEEDELDEEEVSIYGDSETCPEGWEYQEVDCTYLPAHHGLAAYCNQQLVPSTTDLCGDQDRDSVVCLVPDHHTTSTFGMGDGAGMAQQRCVNVEEAF